MKKNQELALAQLAEEPFTFDFDVAMRRLLCAFPALRDAPNRADTGQQVRLGQEPSFSTRPSEVFDFKAPGDEEIGDLRVGALGLFGIFGPLPSHFTQRAIAVRQGNSRQGSGRPLPPQERDAFVAFLDLFHHRFLQLYHQAWAASQPTVSQDAPGENPFSRYIGALAGVNPAKRSTPQALPKELVLQHVGALLSPTRHAEGLETLLQSFFDVPTRVVAFIGEWLDLPEESRWQLGLRQERCQLGRGTLLGKRVFTRDQRFRLVLGPLPRRAFDSFLPGQARLKKLSQVVQNYLRDPLSWDLQLVLSVDEPVRMALGNSRLGIDTRLSTPSKLCSTTPLKLVVQPSHAS